MEKEKAEKSNKTTNDISEKYCQNVKNQLQQIVRENDKILFTYDKQGNTIKEETNTGNKIFKYNTLNQQIKAITKGGNTLVNRYDTEGLRYEIEENEKLSRFIFNKNGDILTEIDKEDNVVSRFVRGYEIVASDVLGQANKCYYIVDEQGSTVLITGSNSLVKNENR